MLNRSYNLSIALVFIIFVCVLRLDRLISMETNSYFSHKNKQRESNHNYKLREKGQFREPEKQFTVFK